MKRKMLEDFLKYAKEQFECDISLMESAMPDTFESVFGTSFLKEDVNREVSAFLYNCRCDIADEA